MTSPPTRPLRIAIIGAGPGGLCMALRLREAGFDDFVLLEKGSGVGGTWYHNLYPGCACDIPAHLYSFSFEPKSDWSRPYATQPELLAYFQGVAEKHDLLRHCRFDDGVRSATWDESRAVWTLECDSGATHEADVVVGSVGMFNELSWPAIEGLDDFEGERFHSARWNWDHDLAGESVGVIGSAASAVQFVPQIVKTAGHVSLFQRTANWVMPKEDDAFPEEVLELFRKDPALVASVRTEIFEGVDEGMTFSDAEAVAELEAQALANLALVEDPLVREKLRPQHPFGCKRPLLSNDFYPAFNEPNLELVTDPIEGITAKGVRTTDGKERAFDTLILATGFSATKYLSSIEVHGRAGLSLDDAWSDGAQAYLGITTAGFPNLFMLYGPNTNNGSIITMIEYQVDYAVRQVQRLADEGLAWMDVRGDAMAAFNEEVQEAMKLVRPWQVGCNGYYRTPSGRIVTQWPFSMTEFQQRTTNPDPSVFETARLDGEARGALRPETNL